VINSVSDHYFIRRLPYFFAREFTRAAIFTFALSALPSGKDRILKDGLIWPHRTRKQKQEIMHCCYDGRRRDAESTTLPNGHMC